MHSQLVVLGGGPGGYAAAFLAADLGMEVTLVEREPRLGGVCLLRGCIPSKALLHVARVISESREIAKWGIEFPPPVINLDALRAKKENIIASLTGGLKQLAKARKVRHVQASGRFENSTTLRLGGGDPKTYDAPRLTFEHCIVATGSSPAIPPAFQVQSPRIMDSTGALALQEIPQSLLVIGGGYIGLEMGTVYAELGAEVSVVELTEGLLPGVDRDLVKPLHDRLKTRFKAIHLEHRVVMLNDVEEAVEVTFEGAEGRMVDRYDRVLIAIGRRPNSQELGLENTAVRVDEKGFVIVDSRQRTQDEHIYAIGDVAGEPMLAHKAAHEGKTAVEVLHGHAAEFDKRAVPAVVFTDPEIAWAGLTETQARQQGIPIAVAQYPWGASGRAQSLGRTDGLTKWLIDPETERVVGVGIVGYGAGELVAEGVLAIEMGCTIRDVCDSVHPHPTLSETLAFAGEAYFGLATEIYKPKRKPNAR